MDALSLLLALVSAACCASNTQATYSASAEDAYVPTGRYTGDPLVGDDIYESDNLYETATNLCPKEHNSKERYLSKLDANLNTNISTIDLDYSFITSRVTFDLTVTCSTDDPTYSFDFKVERLVYYYDEEKGTFIERGPETLFEDKTDEKAKEARLFNLSAGTYYILVRSQERQPLKTIVSYSLAASVYKKFTPRSSASIARMDKINGVKGAIWMADFQPMQIKNPPGPLFEFNWNNARNPLFGYRDFCLEDLAIESSGQPVEIARYFIWDPDLQTDLKNVVDQVYEEWFKKKLARDTYKLAWEDAEKKVEGSLNFAADICDLAGNFVTAFAVISTGLKILSGLSKVAFSLILQTLFPDSNFYSVDFEEYLIALHSVFETVGGSDRRVIQIPVYVTVDWDENNLQGDISYFATAKKFIRTGSKLTDHLYTEDVISSVMSEVTMPGEVYGLGFDPSGKSFVWARPNLLPYAPPQESHPIQLSIPVGVPALSKYETWWLSFTAPKTGVYSFCSTDDPSTVVGLFPAVWNEDNNNTSFGVRSGGYLSSSGVEVGTRYEKSLTEGQTVYARVSGPSFQEWKSTSFWVEEGVGPNHVHSYDDSYRWIDKTWHWAYCLCGDSVRRVHGVASGSSLCLYCHGQAKVGIGQHGLKNEEEGTRYVES